MESHLLAITEEDRFDISINPEPVLKISDTLFLVPLYIMAIIAIINHNHKWPCISAISVSAYDKNQALAEILKYFLKETFVKEAMHP